jgi:hypothetical protein
MQAFANFWKSTKDVISDSASSLFGKNKTQQQNDPEPP